MPSSMGSSQPRDWTQVFCIAGGFFTFWATKKALIYFLDILCSLSMLNYFQLSKHSSLKFLFPRDVVWVPCTQQTPAHPSKNWLMSSLRIWSDTKALQRWRRQQLLVSVTSPLNSCCNYRTMSLWKERTMCCSFLRYLGGSHKRYLDVCWIHGWLDGWKIKVVVGDCY